MINSFPVGTGVRLRAEFHDEAGALANPDSVTLKIAAPGGTPTTVSAQSTTVGVWTYVLLLAVPGDYKYTFTGTGSLSASGNGIIAASEDLAA